MKLEERIRILEANLDRQHTLSRAADGKIGPLLTLEMAMLGCLAALAPKGSTWSIPAAISTTLAAVSLAMSIGALLWAQVPRTEGPKGSVVFFGAITTRTVEQFHEAMRQLSAEEYLKSLADQCHQNAEITVRKFAWVHRGWILALVAVIPWVLAIYQLYRQ